MEDSSRGRAGDVCPSPLAGCGVEADEAEAEAPTGDAWVPPPRGGAQGRGMREAASGAVALRGVESVARGPGGSGLGQQGRGGGGRQGSRAVSPQRGSHAKLDLLLHEVTRLNGRLDVIVDRLGELEEKKDEMRRGRETAT